MQSNHLANFGHRQAGVGRPFEDGAAISARLFKRGPIPLKALLRTFCVGTDLAFRIL